MLKKIKIRFAIFFAVHFPILLIGIELNSEEEQGASGTVAKSSQENEKPNELILRPVPIFKTKTPSTSSDQVDGESEEESSIGIKTPILNKRLRTIQSLPYFSFRPASETDIFTIAGSSNMISMTPEIPSISYTTLPKNYEDTPTIEKYKESVSLYSIQTSNKERARETDFTMPRYFGKGDMIAQSVENLSTTSRPTTRASPIKKVEKSKRLKMLRANLPPLSIHINKEKSKEKKIEWTNKPKKKQKTWTLTTVENAPSSNLQRSLLNATVILT